MEQSENKLDQLKDLNSLEFEIMFIDNICKKLKTLNKSGIKVSTLLFMYMSVIESVKHYKELANETNREIHHADAVNLIINKGEQYLADVANDTSDDVYESKAAYITKAIDDIHELVKELLLVLKNDLTNTDKYSYLKVS